MRLDRWFRRRFPDLPQSHLNKIVRKGEVRVVGQARRGFDPARAGARRCASPRCACRPRPRPAKSGVNPEDAEAIRDMTLYEDRDVIVLNKPYGLAVQGGSGTKRHIDGMLEALADKDGTRPVLVHRLDRDTPACCSWPSRERWPASWARSSARGRRRRSTGRWSRASRSRRRGASRCSSPRARAWATNAGRKGRAGRDLERMRVAKHGDPDAQHSLTLYAVVDKVRRASPGCRCGRSPAAPTNCAPIARRSAIRSSATRNTTARPPTIRRATIPARRPARPRAEAAPARPPADPAPSARRNHRRRRAAARAHEEELRHVRLRAARARPDRGRARCVSDRAIRCARRGGDASAAVKRFYKTARSARRTAARADARRPQGADARKPPLAAKSWPSWRSVAEEWAGRAGRRSVRHADDPAGQSALDGVAAAMDETRAEVVRYAGSTSVLSRRGAGGARRAAAARLRSRARLGGRGARGPLPPGGRDHDVEQPAETLAAVRAAVDWSTTRWRSRRSAWSRR